MPNLVAYLVYVAALVGPLESNQDHLKNAEWAIGEWHREQLAEEDRPIFKKGDAIVLQWHFAWTTNKNALTINNFIVANGKTTGQLDALFGWDKSRQQIIGAGFPTAGAAGMGWKLNAETDRITVITGSKQWVFKKTNPDKLVLIYTDGTEVDFQRIKKKQESLVSVALASSQPEASPRQTWRCPISLRSKTISRIPDPVIRIRFNTLLPGLEKSPCPQDQLCIPSPRVSHFCWRPRSRVPPNKSSMSSFEVVALLMARALRLTSLILESPTGRSSRSDGCAT
jgi:hypothetical protein